MTFSKNKECWRSTKRLHKVQALHNSSKDINLSLQDWSFITEQIIPDFLSLEMHLFSQPSPSPAMVSHTTSTKIKVALLLSTISCIHLLYFATYPTPPYFLSEGCLVYNVFTCWIRSIHQTEKISRKWQGRRIYLNLEIYIIPIQCLTFSIY